MEKKLNVGRKVRIKRYAVYDKYEGQIGIVSKEYEDTEILEVDMPDGEMIMPYSPENEDAQCEWVVEENYNIEGLRDKKFWVKVNNQEDWNQVCGVFQRAGIKWSDGRDANSLPYISSGGILYNQGGDPSLTHGSNISKHEVIPTEQFLNDNQPTDMTTTEKIEKLERELSELKESLNWKPKVGDWVVTTKRELNYTNDGAVGNIGTIYQVQEILEDKAGAWYRRTKGNTDGAKASSLRKATPEEIEEATPKEIKVTIGTEDKEVVISKGKIVAPDGKTVDIKDINMVCSIMVGTRGFNTWTVTFPEVKIGCIESISYDQLKAVQEAYEKLTNN